MNSHAFSYTAPSNIWNHLRMRCFPLVSQAHGAYVLIDSSALSLDTSVDSLSASALCLSQSEKAERSERDTRSKDKGHCVSDECVRSRSVSCLRKVITSPSSPRSICTCS